MFRILGPPPGRDTRGTHQDLWPPLEPGRANPGGATSTVTTATSSRDSSGGATSRSDVSPACPPTPGRGQGTHRERFTGQTLREKNGNEEEFHATFLVWRRRGGEPLIFVLGRGGKAPHPQCSARRRKNSRMDYFFSFFFLARASHPCPFHPTAAPASGQLSTNCLSALSIFIRCPTRVTPNSTKSSLVKAGR